MTGTDTDIGKTYVSRQLADGFAKFMQVVTYAKPIQTGCELKDDLILHAPDFDYVMDGDACMTASYDRHVPYKFEPACSPHLGAKKSGVDIEIGVIMQSMEEVAQTADCTIIEGAGGLMVPINKAYYMLDLIQSIKLPVILVTSPKLGTLNHTFLSFQALVERDIEIAAVVFNEMIAGERDYIFEDNRDTIQEKISPVPLFSMSYGDSISPAIEKFCRSLAQKYL